MTRWNEGAAGLMSMLMCLTGAIEQSFLGYKSGKPASLKQEDPFRLLQRA